MLGEALIEKEGVHCMKAKISHALHFLLGVSKDTRLWGAGVIIGAVLLSISFFIEPESRDLLIQDKIFCADEKATASQTEENFNISSILSRNTEIAAAGVSADMDYIENETDLVLDEDVSISLDDFDALCKIVYSEAGCEDMEGQIMIANVVLNRTKSDIFPDDIQKVIMQPGQFEPVTCGSYFYADPSKMTREAVMSALNGEDLSNGALYFQKSSSKVWDDHVYLFRHGSHSFYK